MPYIGNPIYQSAFVTDQFSGDGSTTAYTMSVAPAGTTNVLVVVSGVVQDPSTYGVVGNTLNFTTAPPTGTGNISCRYLGVPVTGVTTTAYRTVTEFTATASQTTFTPPSYTVGFINVYLNGVLLGSADYTASNGTTVVLTTGASSGNLVTVESFQVSSVANAIPNAAGSVSSSNIVAGAVTPAKLSTGGPSWDTSSNLTVAGTGTFGGYITSTASNISQLVLQPGTGTSSAQVQLSNTGGNYYYGVANSDGSNFGGVTAGYGQVIWRPTGKELAITRSTNIDLKIDSSGRVTIPYQPSFHVRVNSGTYLTTSPVPFSNSVFDVGSNFNTSTYRFTAPIAGKYYLVLNMYLRTLNNQDAYPRYRINGSNVQYSYFNNDNTGGRIDPTVSMNRIFNLSAGDYIDVSFNGAGAYYGGNEETNFYGWLIG